MTDNEIIKALDCCQKTKRYCDECPLENFPYIQACKDELINESYNLINRQKAEIDQFADVNKMVDEVRAEAIREFARRLIEEIDAINYKEYNNYLDTLDIIERIAEEMGCGDND